MSRELFPKQLLPLVSDKTMLQETALRLQGLEAVRDIHVRQPIVICNEEHRFLVAEQLRQINMEAGTIILEPVGRNTAPALTLASACLQEHKSDDDIMLVMAADHVIESLDVFHKAVVEGASLANQDYLITFGVVPTAPETGYGYIRKGDELGYSYNVAAFVEKPDAATAAEYLASGDYLWNSGMFMMKASTWNNVVKALQPAIYDACFNAYRNGEPDHDFFRVSKKDFTACPGDSIDYAVMEKLTHKDSAFHAAVVPLDAGWSDVGAWSSLWEVNTRDAQGNVVKGDVHSVDTHNSLLISEERLLATIGLRDVVVVDTADAVLVANKNASQDVKKVTEWLKKQNREERSIHRKVFRPWGTYEGIDVGHRYQVKRITVNPGASLSLQMHHHRAEHWIVVKGTAMVTCDDKVFMVSENQSTYIPIGSKHRLANPGTIPLEMIEVQSGSYLGEDDIVRYEDNYGRG